MNHDKEEFISDLRVDVSIILKDYYDGEITIAHTLDLLEENGLYTKKRNDVEGELLGNNTYSDEMIDYIVDRMDLEPLLETPYIQE